jgi:hypothetical protein
MNTQNDANTINGETVSNKAADAAENVAAVTVSFFGILWSWMPSFEGIAEFGRKTKNFIVNVWNATKTIGIIAAGYTGFTFLLQLIGEISAQVQGNTAAIAQLGKLVSEITVWNLIF